MAADSTSWGFATQAIHAGQDADPATGATVVPIYATSTYTQAAPGQHKGYEYSRTGNPTRAAFETCLAALEGGERGLGFASGLAATTAVLAQLRPGDEVVAAADLYGGTFRLLERVFKPWGLVTKYTEDPSPAGFARLITPATKLVWVETPTNPLLQIVDIAAIADLAHKAKAPLAVDNTFASPYLQQPIKLGADLVVHSTTKYLGGHSDVVGGAVIGRRDLLGPIAAADHRPTDHVGMPAEVLRRAVNHQIGAQLDRLLQIRRDEGVIDRQRRFRLVGQVGDGGDIDDLQERVCRRLDPDELCRRRDDLAEAVRAGVFGVARHQAPRLEDPFQQAKRAAVEIGGRRHLIAGPQQRKHRRRRRQPRRERQAAFAAFQGSQARLQGGARRVAGTRILVALVNARRLLRIGAGGVDRHDGR